jgi:hypothetical protein
MQIRVAKRSRPIAQLGQSPNGPKAPEVSRSNPTQARSSTRNRTAVYPSRLRTKLPITQSVAVPSSRPPIASPPSPLRPPPAARSGRRRRTVPGGIPEQVSDRSLLSLSRGPETLDLARSSPRHRFETWLDHKIRSTVSYAITVMFCLICGLLRWNLMPRGA